MRAMRGISIVVAAFVLFVAACSGDESTAPSTSLAPSTTVAAAGDTTTSTAASGTSDTTTTATSTTTSATTTTGDSSTTTATTEATGGTTTSTSTTSSTTTTTTTRAPSGAVEAQPPTPGCPGDLFLTTDDYDGSPDNILAAYIPPTQTPAWEIPLGYNAVAGFTTSSTRLFALLQTGTLIAIDLADCGEAWRTELGRGPILGGVAVEDDIVVATGGGRVSAFDSDSGNRLWSDPIVTPAQTPILRDGIAVVAGTTAPWLRSYWMDTGERLFDRSAGFSGTIEAIDAEFDAIYLAGQGRVEGRWIDDGTELFSVDYPLTSAIGLFDIFVYVAGGTNVAALDFDTGEVLWKNTLPQELIPAIGIGGDSVLVFDEGGQAHRLDYTTGSATPGKSYGAFSVWPEFDDSAFLVWKDGTVTVYNMFEEAMFELPTGANGIDRFTQIEIGRDIVVTSTYSAERF